MDVLSAQADDPEAMFGDLAVSLGYMTHEQLSRILLEQADSVPPMREILVEMGVLTRDEMLCQCQIAQREGSTVACYDAVAAGNTTF